MISKIDAEFMLNEGSSEEEYQLREGDEDLKDSTELEANEGNDDVEVLHIAMRQKQDKNL